MEKGKSIRISLVQPEIFFEQKDRNLKQAEAVIKEEVKAGTDLVLLPEMSFTGYSMDTRKVGEVPVTQGAGSSVTQGAEASVGSEQTSTLNRLLFSLHQDISILYCKRIRYC